MNSSPKVKPTREEVETKVYNKPEKNNSGFCIKCSSNINKNSNYPYCSSCYKNWNRHSGDTFKVELYCQFCGKENQSSLSRPVCYSCYKSNKELFAEVNKGV